MGLSWQSTSHRKLALVRLYGDSTASDMEGHGTHVLGTLLGNDYTRSLADYTGGELKRAVRGLQPLMRCPGERASVLDS